MEARKRFLKDRHRKLIAYIRGGWTRLGLAMVCMMVMAASTSATAFLVKPVLDDIFMKKDRNMLAVIPVVVIVLYILRGFAMYGQEYLMQYVGQNIIRQLRDDLYAKITTLPLAFFNEMKTGVLMSRITNDVTIIREMVSTAVTGALRDSFTVLGLIFVIFYRDWKLAIIAILVMPAAIYPIAEFGRKIRRFSTSSQESMGDLNSLLHETFSGNKIVKAFCMEEYEKERFFKNNKILFRYEMKAVRARALTSPVMELLGGIGVSLVIWYGGYGVVSGESTPGTFFSFMTAVMLLYSPVKKLTKLNNTLQRGLSAVDRVFEVLETEAAVKEPENPLLLPPPPHRIVFEDVWFSYDQDRPVLKGINLMVSPGERLAIVGMSGGGKTSLVNLLPRFYDVTGGAIKIDGVDIRDVALRDLRSRIAVVTQEPILFNDTIRNNIAYGRPDADERAIVDAARAAYIYDMIRGLPKGLDTEIGELGNRLSGGEKQRMCIARALIKDASILILDEATSALDTEAERLVQQALENLMAGRTSFVIAHRISTIIDADRIIVISGGRIVEEGDHETLYTLGGEYRRLYDMQFSDKA